MDRRRAQMDTSSALRNHRNLRSDSTASTGIRRAPPPSGSRTIAKAAAQRLANVMAQQATDDDGDDADDDSDDGESSDSQFEPPVSLLPPRKTRQSHSPAIGRYLADQTPPVVNPIKKSPLFDHRKQPRMSFDLGNLSIIRNTTHQPQSPSVLQDEVDILQEENENFVEKLRVAVERCEEAEIRVQQLLKQLSLLGESASPISPEDTRNEVSSRKNVQLASALSMEIKDVKDETTAVLEHLHEAEDEIKHLRTKTQKCVLTQDQMEEMVLKKCWLARFWKLCVEHGILPEISEERHEFWSSQAPPPLQSVLSAGNRAREETSSSFKKKKKKKNQCGDLNEGGDIENFILVEKGLRELASLKVDDAICSAMSQNRHSNYFKVQQQQSSRDESIDNSITHLESLDLTQEECEQVTFKQAWLTYFWRRAKDCGIEVEIADERLKFWIRQSRQYPTNHDAIDVVRGLLELRRMGIETQIWQSSSSSS